MKELGEGSRDIIVSTTGWDINPRVLGIVPKEAKIATLKGFHWVVDAPIRRNPEGPAPRTRRRPARRRQLPADPRPTGLHLRRGLFLPRPRRQGPSPLSMAPAASQAALKEYGRPEYDQLIADNPKEMPLAADKMVMAFRRWDEEIGGKKSK